MAKEKISITATKSHLAKAITPKSMGNVSSACLAAQAIKAVFPRKFVQVFGSTCSIDDVTYDVSKRGEALVTAFDNACSSPDEKAGKKAMTALRQKLPITFTVSLAS